MLSIESIFGLGQYINQASLPKRFTAKTSEEDVKGRRKKTMGACPFCINFQTSLALPLHPKI